MYLPTSLLLFPSPVLFSFSSVLPLQMEQLLSSTSLSKLLLLLMLGFEHPPSFILSTLSTFLSSLLPTFLLSRRLNSSPLFSVSQRCACSSCQGLNIFHATLPHFFSISPPSSSKVYNSGFLLLRSEQPLSLSFPSHSSSLLFSPCLSSSILYYAFSPLLSSYPLVYRVILAVVVNV